MANSTNTTIASRKRTPLTPAQWLAIVLWIGAGIALTVGVIDTLNGGELSRDGIRRAEEDLAAIKERDASSTLGGRAVASLRAELRDPDSLAVDKIFHRPGRGEICINYRARNGFCAMSWGQAVVIGSFVDDTGPNPYRNKVSGNWEVYCTDPVEQLS